MPPTSSTEGTCQHAAAVHGIRDSEARLLPSGQQRQLEITNLLRPSGFLLLATACYRHVSATLAIYDYIMPYIESIHNSSSAQGMPGKAGLCYQVAVHTVRQSLSSFSVLGAKCTTRCAAMPGATTAASGSSPASSGRWEFSSLS